MRHAASRSTPGRIADDTIRPRNTSAITILIFQSARATSTMPRTTSVATAAFRAVCPMPLVLPLHGPDANSKGRGGEAAKRPAMLASAEERVYLDARPHGVVLARPLGEAVLLAGLGGVLLALMVASQEPRALVLVLTRLVAL